MDKLSFLEEAFEEEQDEIEEEDDEEEETGKEEAALEEEKIKRSFFMVWEGNCRNFIEENMEFSCQQAEDNLMIHVFVRKDTPRNASPPFKPWIQSHFSLTTCPYASDSGLTAWLMQKVASRQTLNNDEVLLLVAERERKYEELSAILKANLPNIQIKEINGEDKTILDVLPNVCRWCKTVFLNPNERERHFDQMHDFFCDNLMCEVKRFRSEKELQEHLEKKKLCKLCPEASFCSQKQLLKHVSEAHNVNVFVAKSDVSSTKDAELVCHFCPQKVFSCTEQRDIHMKNCHKKCNCSCDQYFKNRDEYLEHFYAIYPLACFENRKCPKRFQDVRFQAKHHKQDHFSIHPFYCIPCSEVVEDGRKEKVCFKDEKSLRIHCAAMGHDEQDAFLPMSGKVDKVRNALQRRVPSRTCSAINYC